MNWAIQTSFIGDAVLSLPFLHRFFESNNEKLKLIAAPRNEGIFRLARERGLSPYKDRFEIVSWDKKKSRNPLTLLSLADEWSAEKPEKVYCLQRSFSSALLALFSKSPERIGFSTGAASFLYTHCVSRDWDSGRLEIEKNLDLLRAFHPVKAWEDPSPSLLGSSKSQKGVVAFSLSSPWGTKEWDLGEAEKLMRKLMSEGIEVWILGDQKFIPKAALLEKNLESRLLKNFTGKTTLVEWVDLIAQAGALVSGDSAAVHVASDLNIPIVALFGPTVPEFGFAPWRKNARVLSLDMSCRPCDIHGPAICPLKHHRCMKELSADWVHQSLQELLGLS